MRNKLSSIGITILISLFVVFYFVTTIVLDNIRNDVEINNDNSLIGDVDLNYTNEKEIVNNLYQGVRMLYDVVNSKFKVSQEDIIVMNDITYKRIVNFDEVTNKLFTANGLNKYINDLGNYFAYMGDVYYLAGNLVSYQTYYFRGDTTNIYVLDASDNVINAIIYEKWTSNNKNTLATIRVVNENGIWLIDNISILASE